MTDIRRRVRDYLSGSVPRAVVLVGFALYAAFGFFLIRSDNQQNDALLEAARARATLLDYQSKTRDYERCITSVDRVTGLRMIFSRLEAIVPETIASVIDEELPAATVAECGLEPMRPLGMEQP